MKTNRPKTLSLSFTEAYIEIENYGAKKLMFLFSKVEFYSFSLLRCLSIDKIYCDRLRSIFATKF